MCDLKVGDDVVCITPGNWQRIAPFWMFWRRTVPGDGSGPRKGDTGQIVDMAVGDHPYDGSDVVVIHLTGWPDWYDAACFRKVQKRLSETDIRAWVEQPTDGQEPKRDLSPARKREAV